MLACEEHLFSKGWGLCGDPGKEEAEIVRWRRAGRRQRRRHALSQHHKLLAELFPKLALVDKGCRGADLGLESVFSGTVGATMTAMLLGLPAMALSQAFSDRDSVHWQTARALARR